MGSSDPEAVRNFVLSLRLHDNDLSYGNIDVMENEYQNETQGLKKIEGKISRYDLRHLLCQVSSAKRYVEDVSGIPS